MSQPIICAEPDVLQLDAGFPEPGPVRGPAVRRAMRTVTVSWIFGSVWVTATSGAPYSLFAAT